ncbi:four-helix bundle copper-binding protein [Nocardia sputi]|uniref:four-helix bundle copper-binding protein n=1 Tax=Nocardia sputi TaxID=2943705 RepID=UPI0020C0A070|nr:four-helix bundle copper-binding protein [Nocardia sputi]
MNSVAPMIDAHPSAPAHRDELIACLQACRECAGTCAMCADACLSEEAVADLRACIRTDLNCADICVATAAVLSRPGSADTATLRSLLETCALACGQCERECDRHAAHHEHCRLCAEACRRCAQACRALLSVLG